jgi:hypothetical protein
MAIIYHYCNPGAFLSIIESRSLWLGNARKMFDARIGDVVGTMLVDALTQDRQHPGGLSKLAAELALALNLSRRELYTCCFSENRDTTAQWWSYADAGRGFAIGFDSERLHPFREGASTRLAPNALAESARGIALSPVLYGDDATLTRNIETLKSKLTELASERDCARPDRTPHVHAVALACEWLGVMSKDPSFRHELEWRLVYVSPGDANRSGEREPGAAQIQWRTTHYGLTSYFRYGFELDAVREVWIGPNNNERLHPNSLFGIKEHHALKLLMQTHGYERTEIIEGSSRYAI